MKTQRERGEGRRRERLADVQDQVDQGTLKIRRMTPKERADLPPRPRPEKPRRR